MASIVFVLCAAASSACAYLLLRDYRRNRVRLLLWSGVCFIALTLNNILLFVDVHVFPETDLAIARVLPVLIGAGVLLSGMIWES